MFERLNGALETLPVEIYETYSLCLSLWTLGCALNKFRVIEVSSLLII